jgi:hypothetical protein
VRELHEAAKGARPEAIERDLCHRRHISLSLDLKVRTPLRVTLNLGFRSKWEEMTWWSKIHGMDDVILLHIGIQVCMSRKQALLL